MDFKKLLGGKSLARFLLDNAIYIVLCLLIIVIIIIDPTFLSFKTFMAILTQASSRLILALGVGGLIVLAGTDLSVGRMVGLAAVASASLLQAVDYSRRIYGFDPLPVWIVVVIAMILTCIFSTINGIITAKLNVTPFIVTLGTQLIIYGVASIYYERVGASPIAGLDKRFTDFAQGGFKLGSFTMPYILIYAIIATIIMWFIWNKTTLGKNMFAVGGNTEAAAVSGVNIAKTVILIYVLAGLLYGFSGTLEVARTGSATNNMGNGYELDAIAACVVGGVSFSGGVGTIPGIVAGALIFQVINYGLAYISVNPYMQYIIKGLIIVVAVAIDTQKYIKRK